MNGTIEKTARIAQLFFQREVWFDDRLISVHNEGSFILPHGVISGSVINALVRENEKISSSYRHEMGPGFTIRNRKIGISAGRLCEVIEPALMAGRYYRGNILPEEPSRTIQPTSEVHYFWVVEYRMVGYDEFEDMTDYGGFSTFCVRVSADSEVAMRSAQRVLRNSSKRIEAEFPDNHRLLMLSGLIDEADRKYVVDLAWNSSNEWTACAIKRAS